MSQNLVTLNLTDAQLTAVDTALDELETQLAGLIALSATQKKSLRRMGPKSEAFCRDTLRVLDQNPLIVPPGVALADATAGFQTLDGLRPRLMRLSRLSARGADTETALRSDIMSVALQGYNLLKTVGRSRGLDPIRRELAGHFAGQRRRAAEPPPPQAEVSQLAKAA
jgi:hypothetical protein